MSVRDFPPKPQGAEPDSVPYQNWLDALGNRQNIDLQQELTSVASGDEIGIFDVSETGQVKFKKATVANILSLSGGITEIVAPTAFPSANAVDVANIPQNYSAILIVISGLSFDTATRSLRMRVSSDNGSTFNTGGFHGTFIANAVNTAAAGVSSPIAPGVQTAAQTTSMIIVMTGYQAGSFTKFNYAGFDADSVSNSGETAFMTNTSKTDAVRFIMNSTGNFDAGTYGFYGVR